MSVLETPDALDDAAQALFEEARRRTHRRRIRRTIAAAIALAVAVAVAVLTTGGRSTGAYSQTATTPFVDARSFDGHGELAFISRGTLWALDGSSLRRVRLPRGLTPAQPALSPDGRWLAFLATYPNRETSQLWLASADGTGAHEVRGAVDELVGWSPSTDTLAVTSDPQNRHPFFGAPTTLAVIRPDGEVRRLLVFPISYRGSIESATWSPDGRQIGVSLVNFSGRSKTIIRSYPVNGAPPRTWLTLADNEPIPGYCGRCHSPIANLAGWYAGWGIAFWSFAGGMDHNNDSTPLDVVAAPGARPRFLAKTLSDGATDAVAGGLTGDLALVASANDAGREYGQGKVVERCARATRRCSLIPGASIWTGPPQRCVPHLPCDIPHPAVGQPGSGVSLDPAWSPDGALLAYVKAPFALSEGNPPPPWYAAHRLYLSGPRTGATRELATVAGVSQPAWSRDGRSLLYVSGDGLWLVPAAGGGATEIEHPLFTGPQLNGDGTMDVNYYGQINWAGQFSWHSA